MSDDDDFVTVTEKHHRGCDALHFWPGRGCIGGNPPPSRGPCTCDRIEARDKKRAREEAAEVAKQAAKRKLLERLNMTEEELKLLFNL